MADKDTDDKDGLEVDAEGGGGGTYDIEGGGGSGTAGLPPKDDVPDETIEEIEQARKERLDPENRPEGTEVDNTGRTFDEDAGMFTDSDFYEEGEKPYAGGDEDEDEG